MFELRPILMRYGIHGWGESSDLFGIAIFNTSRIEIREVVVSLPTADLANHCNNYERTDGPHASLDAMIQNMHRATNSGADNTRKWFHQANRILSSNGDRTCPRVPSPAPTPETCASNSR